MNSPTAPDPFTTPTDADWLGPYYVSAEMQENWDTSPEMHARVKRLDHLPFQLLTPEQRRERTVVGTLQWRALLSASLFYSGKAAKSKAKGYPEMAYWFEHFRSAVNTKILDRTYRYASAAESVYETFEGRGQEQQDKEDLIADRLPSDRGTQPDKSEP